MILDSNGSGCQEVVFQLGGGTSTRKWDIHVTQYTCEEADNGSMGGPKGKLLVILVFKFIILRI